MHQETHRSLLGRRREDSSPISLRRVSTVDAERAERRGEASNSDYLQSYSTFISSFFIFFFPSWRFSQTQERCANERSKRTRFNRTGLWDYWTDYRTIIGAKKKSRSRAIDALEWREHKRLCRSESSMSCLFYFVVWAGCACNERNPYATVCRTGKKVNALWMAMLHFWMSGFAVASVSHEGNALLRATV